jgi:tetraacyldisaccharide 4'-kinase
MPFSIGAMGRDVDIVLIDATVPSVTETYFPAGILREHLRALERASLVVITKADQISQKSLRPLEEELEKFIPRERLFRSSIVLKEWFHFREGRWCRPPSRRAGSTPSPFAHRQSQKFHPRLKNLG